MNVKHTRTSSYKFIYSDTLNARVYDAVTLIVNDRFGITNNMEVVKTFSFKLLNEVAVEVLRNVSLYFRFFAFKSFPLAAETGFD